MKCRLARESEINGLRAVRGGLWIALYALAAGAGAQAPSTSPGVGTHAPRESAYACVDPSDVSARRVLQDEPCRWPMINLPIASADDARRWPAYPARSPAAQDGHAMFWRFPVQPMGPLDAPRHTRR